MGLPFALTVGALAFLLGVIWGGPFIEILRRLRIGKQIRVELSEQQQKKVGTPTMGGIMIILPVVLIALGLNIVSVIRTVTGPSILLPLFVLVGFGMLGAIDDWEGIQLSRGPRGEGLSGRVKFAAQVALATFVAVIISQYDGGFTYANSVLIPLLGEIPVSPIFFIPITVFFIVASSNAVNLTDGLDGLAGIITASAFAAYGVIAFLQQQIFITQFCFLMVGSCFGFLWYNAYPAQLFMGDTGSLALGAALGTVAVMTGQWLLLPVVAIVPIAETLSVILQVASAKYTRRYWGVDRRIFRQAPLHGHFELGGWSETQIVQRFWLVGLLAAMLGVALALV
ncbi:MAG: phospho-N-acetylmuramoyl-pentapeptide-transferase [Anaerolineae bacterium]|nr:phospho-N-acetylmuramoyl-pentapeptide-transferase [Anaerolineae bacterium]